MSTDPAAAFEDFWTASSLTGANRFRFLERIASFQPAVPPVDPWSRPGSPAPVEHLEGQLADLLQQRRSTRQFATTPLADGELGRLLSVLADTTDGRGHGTAGGMVTIRAIVLSWTADRTAGRVRQHDPTDHTLTEIGPCPDWEELLDDLGGRDALSPPAAVVGLFADTSQLLGKYGERAGRFALIEAGAVLQDLGLAAAALGLVGYAIGGASDARMLDLAGLSRQATGVNPSARYVVSYAVGHPPT